MTAVKEDEGFKSLGLKVTDSELWDGRARDKRRVGE